MKIRYWIVIGFLVIATAICAYLVISQWGEMYPHLGDVIQIVGVFVALITAVIALGTANPKTKKVRIKITPPSLSDKEEYGKEKMSPELQEKYEKFPVESHRVHFKMKNTSGFDLKNPVITFNKLPIEKQRPYKKEGDALYSTRHFTFSIVRTDRKSHFLEVDEKYQLICIDGLPYWNKNNEIDLWVRMVLGNSGKDPFEIEISVNCENADGSYQMVEIKPDELIANANI
jgi:hypothetical protein